MKKQWTITLTALVLFTSISTTSAQCNVDSSTVAKTTRRSEKMPSIVLHHTVDAPADQVWASWNDFGNVYKFNPVLSHSQLLAESPKEGVGCSRECNMKDGKNWVRERIIDYSPNKSMTVDIYQGTMPLRKAQAVVEINPINAHKTDVKFTMRFEPKFGILGKMMVPMMKAQFRKMLGELLIANSAFVTQGKEVN